MYNGPKTKLMDDLVSMLSEHVDVEEFDDWFQLSLYIAKACYDLEHNGYRKENTDDCVCIR